MAYDKQTWVSGEVITATKLNHMEDGIAGAGSGGGSFIITITTTWTQEGDDWISTNEFDKTPAEALAAYEAGQTIKVHVVEIEEGQEPNDRGYFAVSSKVPYTSSRTMFLVEMPSYNTHDSLVEVNWGKLIWEAETAFDTWLIS